MTDLYLKRVAVGCLCALWCAACGPTTETPTQQEDAGGFELVEPMQDAGGQADMAPQIVVDMMQPDMNSPLDMGGIEQDMDPAPQDMAAEDMPTEDQSESPLDMGREDLPDMTDMDPAPQDMAPDLGPGVYPPVTSAPLAGAGRPAEIAVPAGFDNSREVPLILALHGYGGNGGLMEGPSRYFSLARNVDTRDFILVSPEGTTDAFGSKFWNATEACCDGFNSNIDDATYLRGLIEEAIQRFRIDRGQIYVAGYSNGGFMAYRMACDSADYITGIFTLAGGTFKDPALCQPSEPVQVIQLHGTSDQTISYTGGSAYITGPEHPGAVETVTNWATYNGCQTTPVMRDATQVNAVTVEDATVLGFDGCPQGGSVELWTLDGAPHNPGLPQSIGELILDRFFAIDRTP